MGTRRIGELLVADGLLSEDAVHRALGFQKHSGDRIRIGSILVNWDVLAEDALLATLSKFHRCPAVGWETLAAADIDVVRLLSPAQASRLAAMPYALAKGTVHIAFANPSDLAVIDEVSAIVGKRVASGVATEVRLLQAHQKFYGSHIPVPVLSIVRKLDRRRTQTRVLKPLDQTDSEEPVSVQHPAVDSSRPPELLALDPQISSASPDADFLSAQSPSHDPEPRGEAPALADAKIPGEDSLTEWVGDALSSYQRDRGVVGGSKPPADPFGPSSSSADLASPAAHADAITSMWRSSQMKDAEEVASGMWTSSEEADSPLWEARNRDEIGEAVLQNALTNLPRVLLFGVGKTTITGWLGRGLDPSREDIASARISTSEDSVFAAIERSGVPHFGPVEEGEWPRAFAGLLGERPLDCAIFPIRILDGVAAFLYVDRLGQPMEYQDFALIARAAASTANILARFLQRPNTASVGL